MLWLLVLVLLALVLTVAPAGCFFGGPVPVSVSPPLPMSLMGSCLKEVVVLAPHQGDLLQLEAVHLHGGGRGGSSRGRCGVGAGAAGGVSRIGGVHVVLQVSPVWGSGP